MSSCRISNELSFILNSLGFWGYEDELQRAKTWSSKAGRIAETKDRVGEYFSKPTSSQFQLANRRNGNMVDPLANQNDDDKIHSCVNNLEQRTGN